MFAKQVSFFNLATVAGLAMITVAVVGGIAVLDKVDQPAYALDALVVVVLAFGIVCVKVGSDKVIEQVERFFPK